MASPHTSQQPNQSNVSSHSSPQTSDQQQQFNRQENYLQIEQPHSFQQRPSHDLPPTTLRPLQPQPTFAPTLPPMYSAPFHPSTGPVPYSQTSSPARRLLDGSSTSDQDPKRIRVSRACDVCRRKKVKCNTNGAGSACKNCRLANTVCTFNDSAKKRGPPKGYIDVLENRLKRMEKLLGGIVDGEGTDSNTSDDQQNIKGESSTSPPSTHKPTNTSTPPPPPLCDDRLNSITSTTGDVVSPRPPPPATTTTKKTSLCDPVREQSALDTKHNPRSRPLAASQETDPSSQNNSSIAETHPRYIGDMSMLPFLAQKFNFEDDRFISPIGIKIRRFGNSLVMFEKGDNTTGRTPSQLLLETLGILKPGEPILGVDDWISKVADISKPTSDLLMKVYFAYIHPGLPVINKTLFLNQYRGLADDYPSAPLLNAMYGAATRYIETCRVFGDETAILDAFDNNIDGWKMPEGGSERLFDNLIKYVRGRYNPNIATIQALVIAQNHRASMEGKMTGGWLINAAAIRMAQDLGLHRSSEHWDISEDEKETRRRVWWAVYIMDKWSAASTGRPQTIFDEDCDERYPSESAPWEEVMDVPTTETAITEDHPQLRFPSLDKSVAQKATGERIPIYQPFVQLAKLSEILGHILQCLYTPRAKKYSAEHGSDAIVSYLDKALSDWRAALPPTLQISGTNLRKLDSRGRTPLLSMSGLMYLSYCTLLILLHRPFIEKEGGEKTRSSLSSLSICTSAATRCVDVATSMHFRDFLLVSWNFAIYHVFTASLIHIHTVANSGSVVSDLAKGDLIKAIRVVKRLSNLSAAACQIHQVLLRLMKMRNIPYTDPSDDNSDNENGCREDQAKHSNKGRTKDKKASSASIATKARTNLSRPDTMATDTTTKSGMSPRISDVGRGQITHKLTARSPSADPPSTTVNSVQQPHDDRASSASSTPTSLTNGDWINGLYSSIQQEDNQGPLPNVNPYLEADPNSLQHFGMNIEQMFTPIDQMSTTINTNSDLPMYQSQPLNFASEGLSQNFLFGLSNIGFAAGGTLPSPPLPQQSSLQPIRDTTGGHPSPSNSQQVGQPGSSYTYPLPMPSSIPGRTVPSQLPMVDQSLFRNRPDNPFWSVPSSLEMDDWAAYLLPSNGDQQHQQENQRRYQQQTWPSGWL